MLTLTGASTAHLSRYGLVGLLLAFALANQLTPRMARAARALGIVDRPDGHLKRQRAPVPYLGGMAIFLAALLAASATGDNGRVHLAIALGGTLLTMLGLFDDLHALGPGHKLLGQAVGAYVLAQAGVGIHLAALPAPLAALATVLWLLTVTNAVNLVDVSDGFAAAVCVPPCLGLLALACRQGDAASISLAGCLAGSLLGFCRYNRAPARIYMGDCGALFVGFTLAALCLQARYTQKHTWAALCPVILLSVPLLDLVVVTLVRLARGHSPLRGSPDHVALLLRGWDLSANQAAAAAGFCSAACTGVALAVAWGEAGLSAVLLGGWAGSWSAATAFFVAVAQARYRAANATQAPARERCAPAPSPSA